MNENRRSKTKFICVSGKGGSGKDTFSEALKDEFDNRGLKSVVTHYADPLKMYAKSFFGWNGEKDDFGRSLLQYLGTDIVRKQNEDFWVDMLLNFVSLFDNQWDYIIVADCRFPNELERIKEKYDCYCVRVDRDTSKSSMSEDNKKHSSETALDEYLKLENTLFIDNNGSLEELRTKAVEVINFIEKGINN